MNARVLILLLVTTPAAVVPWLYGHKHRVIAWLFAITAFLLVAGVPPWREALVSLIANPSGLAVLTGLDVAFGLGFWFEAVHRPKRPAPAGSAVVPIQGGKRRGAPRPARPGPRHHHRVRTPVVAMVFATCAALTLGAGGEMLAQLDKSPGATTSAISQSARQISQIAGHRHAAPMSHQQAGVIVVVAVIVLVVLIAAASSMEKRRGGGKGPKAISPASGFAKGSR